MSRHRTVRSKNFSDEYDGLDECFGHSVEDDYCVSPSAEQFMYDRSKQANIASFITEPDIVENIEELEDMPSSYKVPHLSDIDAAKLMSCIETVRNVIGDTYPESELNRKIIEFRFNTEAVINSILNDETSKNVTTVSGKQPLDKTFEAHSGSKFKNFFSDNASASILSNMSKKSDQKCNLKKGSDKSSQGFFCLSKMITNTAKALEKNPNPFSSLAGLSACHLKISEKKPNSSSTFSIPKVNFNNSKQSAVSSDESPGFNSLADLTAHHLRISNDNKPSGFIIPKIEPKDFKSGKSDTPSFGSLAELTAHHLKISNDKNDSQKIFGSPSGFLIPKMGPTNNESNQSSSPSFDSLAELTAHHLKISNKNAQSSGFVISKKTDKDVKPSLEYFSNLKMRIKNKKGIDLNNKLTKPNLSIKKEKSLEDCTYSNFPKSVLEDISNLPIEEQYDPNKVIKSEPIDFPTHSVPVNQLSESLAAIKRECIQNRAKAMTQQKLASSFGKVLCKRFSRKLPYPKKAVNSTLTISPFDFSSPSPDAIVLARLRRGVVV